MVGDSPRDVEAGQRAGCRTIRIRVKGEEGAEPAAVHHGLDAEQDEDVQADFTVRNLVDAARMILRASAPGPVAGGRAFGAAESASAGTASPLGAGRPRPEEMSDSQVLREILTHLRRLDPHKAEGEFSAMRLLGTVLQMVAGIAFLVALAYLAGAAGSPANRVTAHLALLVAGVSQAMALTFFVLARRR
jgi:hypothetical protein